MQVSTFDAGELVLRIGNTSSSARFSAAAARDIVKQLLVRLCFALRLYDFRRRLQDVFRSATVEPAHGTAENCCVFTLLACFLVSPARSIGRWIAPQGLSLLHVVCPREVFVVGERHHPYGNPSGLRPGAC